MFTVDPMVHQAVAMALTVAAVVLFAWERWPMEQTAIAVLTTALIYGSLFPLAGAGGVNLIGPDRILSGFANPTLIAILALLVVGQGMVQTEALAGVIANLSRLARPRPGLAIAVTLVGLMMLSAMMNSTPLVVLGIPIIQALARQADRSTSSLMLPLSYAAILGGMTTLIGSSTNMLVSTAMVANGMDALDFFAFTWPGLILAAVGFTYVIVVLPRLLPERQTLAGEMLGANRQFLAELDIAPDSRLIGEKPASGMFPTLPGLTVRLVQRGPVPLLPPFEDYEIRAGDTLIVAATRQTLSELLARNPGSFLEEVDPPARRPHDSEAAGQPERVIAEVMIAPASRLADQSLEQVAFHPRLGRPSGVHVFGIQRRARMVRGRLADIRLEAGDVLLIAGSIGAVEAVQDPSDVILLAGSQREMPLRDRRFHALGVLIGTVAIAAIGILPIAVAAILGAVVSVALGCLNMRQALRAIDRRILFMVATALALGTLIDVSGAAALVARSAVLALVDPSPLVAASLLFLVVAVATNLISNNACAVLFTPLALNLAREVNVDPEVFAITVVFAANCSFATPMGYQTNLLVMGPGHYRFRDYLLGGVPLVVLIWATYCLVAWQYYGL